MPPPARLRAARSRVPDPPAPNSPQDPSLARSISRALPSPLLTMVPSSSRGGLECIWARCTGSLRARPVRPLSSCTAGKDIAARNDYGQQPAVSQGREVKMAVRDGNSGCGEAGKERPGNLPEMTQGHTSRPAPVIFWRVPRKSQSTPSHHRWAGHGGAFLSVMFPPSNVS